MNRVIQIVGVAGDPSAVANSTVLYAKTVSGSVRVFMRDSSGNIVQLGAGSSAATAVFTFRPGSGLSGPLMFDSFSALYTELDTRRSADGGHYKIIMDDQSDPGNLEIPADSYDMAGVEWEGVNGPSNQLATPVTVIDGGSIINLRAITGLSLVKESGIAGTAPIELAAGTQLTVTACTLRGGNVADSHLFRTTGAGLSYLRLMDYSIVQNSDDQVFLVDTGHTLVVLLNSGPILIQDNVFKGNGTVSFQANDSGVGVDTTQPDIAVTEVAQNVPQWFWPDGNPNGIVQASLGFKLIDTVTGTMYTNDDGATGWV